MAVVKINVGLAAIVGRRVELDPVEVFQIAKLCERGCVGDAEAVFGRDAVRGVLRELTVGPNDLDVRGAGS